MVSSIKAHVRSLGFASSKEGYERYAKRDMREI